jgi:hypothetical protein
MTSTLSDRPGVGASAERLQRAAGDLLERSGTHAAVQELPTTLEHLQEVLDRLATSLVRMAEAVAERPEPPGATAGRGGLPPDARALVWHLHDVATHVRASSTACDGARQWADELTAGAWGDEGRRVPPRIAVRTPSLRA